MNRDCRKFSKAVLWPHGGQMSGETEKVGEGQRVYFRIVRIIM